MKQSRRNFLSASATGTLAFILPATALKASSPSHLFIDSDDRSPDELASDEEYWARVRDCYSISPSLINMNNGGVSPQPKQVQEAHIRNYHLANEGPSYYMWRIIDRGRETLRRNLAQLAGCSTEEIAINRNSTEGLNSVIFGLPLKTGDEVILSKYDYPNMINAWKQREKRDGLVLRWVDFDPTQDSDEQIIHKYAEQMNERTRLTHIVHVVNWNGRIMPVKQIANFAKQKGSEVLVDGAHSFAQLQFTIPDLNCDYFATSLHKWLGAPFGSGMLYIRKEKIRNVWSLLSCPDLDSDDIRKFEFLGTRSNASEMAIDTAIEFHNRIGTEKKEARLRYLKNYWVNKVRKLEKVKIHTPLGDSQSCAIAFFSLDNKTPEQTETYLMEKKRIHVICVHWEKIHGLRVTPNVYTSLHELDLLVEGIKELSEG